jgi:myo-inositol-1(or 4)-monophosphatase
VIRDIVLSHYPDHGFIGEEFGAIKSDSPYQWVVDPIDGTRAFISGSPLWGSLIGLCFEGKPLAGMMNQPFIDERFWGLAEEAYWQRGDAVHRLSVRETAQLAEATIMTTCPDLFATSEDFLKFESLRAKCRMTRFGGDCYSYCLLALGTIDLVVETGLQDYDIAPLVPIITAAGGLVTDWQGNEISLKSSSAADTQSSGQIIAASTKAVHEAALEVLKAAAA